MDNGTHALNIFTSFVDNSFVAWNFFWLVFCFCLYVVVDGEGESSVGSPVSAAEVSDGGLLYRVKSCPGIVDQVESSQNSQPQPNDMDDQLLRSIHLELQLSESREETRVQLRVRSQSRVSQTQLQQHRYSCGALEDHQRQMATSSTEQSALCSPCGSRHNSNPSLNCNGYSFIQVQ